MTQLRSILGPIFHVGFVIHHFNAFGYYHKVNQEFERVHITDQRILDMKNFGALFFTNWNLALQTVYFVLAVLHDVLNICSVLPMLKQKVGSWRGFMFTSLVFPSTIFVSAMFWGLFSINREWVLPKVCDEYVPEWLNHSVHTNVTVFLIIEVLIVNQLLPSFKSALIGLTVLTIIYDITFFIAYFVFERWIYGLFYVFSWPERIVFVLFNYFSTVFVMKIGMTIQKFKHTLIVGSKTRKIKI